MDQDEVSGAAAGGDSQPARVSWRICFRNRLSVTGLVIALGTGLFHLSLLAQELGEGLHNPYLNIWFHIILPPFVVFGFFLALLGAWRERRRIRLHGGAPAAPMQARKGLVLGGIVTVILLVPFLALTSYTGYHYTDSVEFCGAVCHVPMSPVYAAYKVSPHARVACASCHIGEGASWFVRSKLSGTRQVFATLLDSFHRPIETPIENLRPARETCERCHWPEKAFGSKIIDLPHYAADENNSRRPLSMVLKTGGGDPSRMEVSGIHWHSVAAHQTEYVATDRERLEIPWVRTVTKDGVRVYRSDGLPADAPPPEGELRRMDCIDCHNRPSHKFLCPDVTTNRLLALGSLDASLPYLKREAATLMEAPYEDTPSARAAIESGLKDFYASNYPELAATKAAELESSIQAVLQAFEQSIFPEMQTDWRSDPDHIGHKYSPGCFRCHDDRHVTDDGAMIRRDCTLCHEFMEHREVDGVQVLEHSAYRHPFELQGAHASLDCDACHDGGPTPAPDCAACHREIEDFMAGRLDSFPDLIGKPHPHHGELECIDCHEEQEHLSPEDVLPLCEMCHDDEEGLAAKKAQLDAAAKARTAATSSPILEALDRVRPVHNLDFALKILGADGSPPAAKPDPVDGE